MKFSAAHLSISFYAAAFAEKDHISLGLERVLEMLYKLQKFHKIPVPTQEEC